MLQIARALHTRLRKISRAERTALESTNVSALEGRPPNDCQDVARFLAWELVHLVLLSREMFSVQKMIHNDMRLGLTPSWPLKWCVLWRDKL